ncbi:MAG: CoA transferase [Chloroflexi bacterium]|nr:CoA transferase [Chloroflexota bacterium]
MVGVLAGIRVLDLTRLLPGAVATMMLADLGADVVKVEDPNGGDYARWMPPLVNGVSSIFAVNNRGKRSLVLDLKHAEGPELLLKLAVTSDVLIESFRPGTLERIGIGPDRLLAANSRLIVCRMSGWGATGPEVARSGHDLNYVARAGQVAIGSDAQVPRAQVADIGGAYAAVASILAALYARERSGDGAVLDISLAEAALPFSMFNWAERAVPYDEWGAGALTGEWACYRAYATADARTVTVAALEPKFWQAFCGAVERPEWIPLHSERDAQPALIDAAAAMFASKPADHWDALLKDVDCCFAVALPSGDIHTDPQFSARGMLGLGGDGLPWMRSPLAMSTTRADGAVPGYGEHTAEVIREAGMDDEELLRLIRCGCIKAGHVDVDHG